MTSNPSLCWLYGNMTLIAFEVPDDKRHVCCSVICYTDSRWTEEQRYRSGARLKRRIPHDWRTDFKCQQTKAAEDTQ